jgi:hypothetical protein
LTLQPPLRAQESFIVIMFVVNTRSEILLSVCLGHEGAECKGCCGKYNPP